LILGKRSKRNLLTGIKTMSMEDLLAMAMAHSPDFDPALALGRIHSILSALIRYCKTRAAYPDTDYFTCELQIRSGSDARVLPVAPDHKAMEELTSVWELVREMDVPAGALVSRSLPLLPLNLTTRG
jgi:hypothetical protein